MSPSPCLPACCSLSVPPTARFLPTTQPTIPTQPTPFLPHPHLSQHIRRTLGLLREKKAQIEAIAELLLKKETINHDDIVGAIGPRPFAAHKEYQEFIESIKPVQQQPEAAAAGDEQAAKQEDEQAANGSGGLPPNLTPA